MLLKNKLYLASKSISRQNLLKKSDINFIVLDQEIQELRVNEKNSLEENVKEIALSKIDQVIFENAIQDEVRFVLAADTLGMDKINNNFLTKPQNYDHAVLMLKNSNLNTNLCSTAFCIDKRIYNNNKWQIISREVKVVTSEYIFHVPDNYIDFYIKNSNALKASGAITI